MEENVCTSVHVVSKQEAAIQIRGEVCSLSFYVLWLKRM